MGSAPRRAVGMLRCSGFDAMLASSVREESIATLSAKTILVHEAQMDGLASLIRVENDLSGNLKSLANFARFLIPDMLHDFSPSIKAVMYLDADVLVQGDIASLLSVPRHSPDAQEQEHEQKREQQQQRSEVADPARRAVPSPVFTDACHILAAVPRDRTMGSFFQQAVLSLYEVEEKQRIDPAATTFNAGIAVFNVAAWVEQGVLQHIIKWMQHHQDQNLWGFGTQPLLLLVSYGKWSLMDARWNVDKLGYKADMDQELLQSAHILHWTGPRKPWLADGLYKGLWARYHVLECNGRGQCAAETGTCMSVSRTNLRYTLLRQPQQATPQEEPTPTTVF